jgi:hypothetical protein
MGVDGKPMNCTVNHSLFLRSNGSLACWCDYGSLKTLQPFDPSLDYAEDVYLGKVYGYIRDRLASDAMPFPPYCSKCMVLLPTAPYTTADPEHRYVDTFQVEPSMACQLDCPGCIPIKERKTRVERTWCGHLFLAPQILEKILKDFRRAGIRIRTFDFQGHGEPLLSPDVWGMVATAKSLFPESYATMCTNANAEFRDEMIDAGLDQIMFAIDGMDQPSYAPYRVHGDFDQAYAFMRAFSRATHARDRAIDTVWKYVLFRHNDRPEQLLAAQELAREAQVTELRFVVTQLGPMSTLIVDDGDIPRADNGVNVRIENYKVSPDQLEDGIAAARAGLDADRVAQATQAVTFVATMMKRLFSESQTVPPRYAPFLHAVHDLAERLPDGSRTAILREVEHLSIP